MMMMAGEGKMLQEVSSETDLTPESYSKLVSCVYCLVMEEQRERV